MIKEMNTKLSVEFPISPLTVNTAWRGGRRFNTREYLSFKETIAAMSLRINPIVDDVPLEVSYRFFVKNFGARDVDNMVKPFQDAIVSAGLIPDDRLIQRFTAEKIKVNTVAEEKIEAVIKPI
jgi:Holliday junction resolvase RusA-like endonuclease